MNYRDIINWPGEISHWIRTATGAGEIEIIAELEQPRLHPGQLRHSFRYNCQNQLHLYQIPAQSIINLSFLPCLAINDDNSISKVRRKDLDFYFDDLYLTVKLALSAITWIDDDLVIALASLCWQPRSFPTSFWRWSVTVFKSLSTQPRKKKMFNFPASKSTSMNNWCQSSG